MTRIFWGQTVKTGGLLKGYWTSLGAAWSLLWSLAESRLQRARPGSFAELGKLVGQVRKMISVAAVKAQVDCLLAKLHQVGPGNTQLAKGREWAVREYERMKRERGTQWIRRVEGLHTIRKGFIKTA